jgi:hypothetical protein
MKLPLRNPVGMIWDRFSDRWWWSPPSFSDRMLDWMWTLLLFKAVILVLFMAVLGVMDLTWSIR